MPNIPKPKKPTSQNNIVPKPKLKNFESGISFSFESLETNDYFNLDGTCINWSSELFEMLRNVSSIPKTDLIQGSYATYRVHSHENAKPPVPLPEGVALKDFYQIRISKSKGGIHGVFHDDIFYVIWLDPLHNMYPSEHYGGLRKVKSGSSCCKDRDLELIDLKKENESLREENKEWENIINNS